MHTMTESLPDTRPNTPTVDELDREFMEQLHAATLKASDLCYEMKKLCATVLAPVAAVVTVLNDRRPNILLFVVGLLVVVAFWMADTVGFFYQRRLRAQMSLVWKRRAARCDGDEEFVVPVVEEVTVIRAAFDASMIFYLIMSIVIVAGAGMYGLSRVT
jgi:hypothetical protein